MSHVDEENALARLLEAEELPSEQCLADRLIEKVVLSNFQDPPRKYLPAGTITELITEKEIEKTLKGIDGQSEEELSVQKLQIGKLVTWISAKAKKVFAICITIGLKGRLLIISMLLFEKHSFDDGSLPWENVDNKYSNGDVFDPRIWTTGRRDDFYEKQWRFLAPVFSPSDYNYDLKYNCILPFKKGPSGPKAGAFGSVCMVSVHPDHQKHDRMLDVAIKEILVTRGNDESGTNSAWDLEARALIKINKLNHSHITKCIAAIRRGDSRYFMFPWAQGGSLRDYWEQSPKPRPSTELIAEAIQQLRGLADALHSLHHCSMHSSSFSEQEHADDQPPAKRPRLVVQDEGNEVVDVLDNIDVSQGSIRHGDLKPENILRFPQQQTGLGILKIADMGLAKQHIMNTQDRTHLTSTRYGTVQYEAPEAAVLTGGRSRLYDVWSLGCITLEFIIWILYGNDAIISFHSQVQGTAQQVCQYFEVSSGEDDAEEAQTRPKVHKVVLQWIDHIKRHDPECLETTAVSDLVDLVRDRLLVIDLPLDNASNKVDEPNHADPNLEQSQTRYRATAKQLCKELDIILARISQSQTQESSYCFTGKPRNHVKIPRLRIHGSTLGVPGLIPGAPVSSSSHAHSRIGGPSARVADYTLPPLKDWQFIVDNKFAENLVLRVKSGLGHSQDSSPTKLCKHCEELNFWVGGFTMTRQWHTLEERAQFCDCCKLISGCRPDSNYSSNLILLERTQSTLVRSGNPFPVLSIMRNPGFVTPIPIQIGLPKLPDPRSDSFFQILRSWLDDCDINHVECESILYNDLPTRLIYVGTSDKNDLRLVETAEEKVLSKNYIALSHPWGDTKKYKPFSTLRKDHSGSGHELESFKKSISYDELPATFRDAVYCARKLGIQYLWIDSICIVQGKDGDFNEEVRKIEDVYSGAYCVIAASRATGQHDGFLGQRPQQEYVTFKRGPAGEFFYLSKTIDNFSKDVIEGSLNKRGWVLQERALARRTIYFTENQTYFECGSGVRCETLTKMQNNMADFLGDPRFPEKAMRSSSRALKIEYFQDLYRLYSRLEFTQYADRPFAVAGLERRLLKAFETMGGFGIFDDGDKPDGGLFHRSLLWQRAAETPNLSPIDFPAERDIRVPSWSWMAYKGAIDYADPPYRSAHWEKNEVSPPWTRGTIQHTNSMPRRGEVALRAIVRDFRVGGRKENEVKLVYDTERTTGSDGERAQCVVIAKSTEARSDRERVFYVLLVAPTRRVIGRGEKVYERIGAGTMLGKFITLDGQGISAKIH